MRRACCASIFFSSSSPGASRARFTAPLVISRKVTRWEAVTVLLVTELLGHMVCDRLSLAVGVRREDHGVDVLRLFLELRDDLPLPSDRHVLRLEAVVDVHAELLLGEVTHVTDRRGYLVVAPPGISRWFGPSPVIRR